MSLIGFWLNFFVGYPRKIMGFYALIKGQKVLFSKCVYYVNILCSLFYSSFTVLSV